MAQPRSICSSNKKPKVLAKLKQMVNDYSGWHWLNEGYRIKLDPPAVERLAELRVPTQIIVGELDLAYYHDIAKILVTKIANSQLHIIKDAGHLPNLENTIKFNCVLDSFINNENN